MNRLLLKEFRDIKLELFKIHPNGEWENIYQLSQIAAEIQRNRILHTMLSSIKRAIENKETIQIELMHEISNTIIEATKKITDKWPSVDGWHGKY